MRARPLQRTRRRVWLKSLLRSCFERFRDPAHSTDADSSTLINWQSLTAGWRAVKERELACVQQKSRVFNPAFLTHSTKRTLNCFALDAAPQTGACQPHTV